MNSYLSPYGGIEQAAQSIAIRPASIRERLEQERTYLTQRLNTVETALDALNDNPNIDNVLEKISKAIS